MGEVDRPGAAGDKYAFNVTTIREADGGVSMTSPRPSLRKSANRASALALAVAGLASAAAGGAWGQALVGAAAAPGAEVQEVIVTATRREEKLHDVPESASVLSPSDLAVLGTAGQDIRQLAFTVPSLNIESSNGRTFPRFYIRGYGNTDFTSFASQPVSLVYDDIVQENPALKGFPIFDQADVEVLRGPQGTLFGRNSPAGVVKLESAKPQLNVFDGYFSASDGTYNTANIEAVVNIPISDKIAIRASTQEQYRDSWVYDPINNTHLEGYSDWAGRLQLLYQPDANFSALFNVHGRSLDGSARLFRANIIVPGTDQLIPGFDPATIYTDGKNTQTFSSLGANARLTWSVPGWKLYSITGYETILHYFTQGDIDGGYGDGGDFGPPPAGIPVPPNYIGFPVETSGGINSHKQITQEFRAASDWSGPLQVQGGVFLFYEDVTAFSDDYDPSGATLVDTTISRQRNDAEAVFASVDYKVIPKLRLRAGVRWTEDHKRFDLVSDETTVPPIVSLGDSPPYTEKATASNISWDVSATYELQPDLNLYTRIATGFRAPSFGAPAPGLAIQVARSEDDISYEGGIKADLFDRKATLAFDVYYYDVSHQQLTVVGGASNLTELINAKTTIGDGAELDFDAHPTRNLTVHLSGSLNETKIEDPTLSVAELCNMCIVTNPLNAEGGAIINGNPLPQAAKWQADWSVRYDYPLNDGRNLYVSTDWSYRSKINFLLYESKEFTGPPLLNGGLRAGYSWKSGKYELAVFCRNCTNQIRVVGAIDFDDLTGFINDPRIVGAQFTGKF
jgi:iron complex outermembrane receptor protein